MYVCMYVCVHSDSLLTVITRMGVSEMVFLRTQKTKQPTHLI